MKESKDLTKYKRQLHDNLKRVAPIFAKASIGDFSEDVTIPEKDDDLTVFLVGVQIILDAIRENISESDSRMVRLNAANEQLENDKAIYHSILASMAEGLVAVDKDSRITLINETASRTLGIDPKLAVGANYYDLVVTKDRDGNVIPVDKRPLSIALKDRKQQFTGTAEGIQYTLSNGRTIPVSITASPVMLGDRVIGGVSTFRDISQEIALDRTKTEIISIASHQLRTPLTAIKWLTEQLSAPSSRISRFRTRRKLRQIHESNERMISLVNDLLNVSRIDLGKIMVMPQEVDLKVIVGDVLRDMTGQVRRKQLKVVRHIDTPLRHIYSDPRYLQVILQNLISNAVKYSFNKKSVAIMATIKDNDLQLTIADKGCGIPSAQQSKIFDKLFRADNARQMVSEGSGLGLYVTKALTQQLGGKIWFESVENEGSTFFVSIPLSKPGEYRAEQAI